ncbi:MAG: hypothetical protein ACYC40_03065, partial [Patescibacteria group bacterium]
CPPAASTRTRYTYATSACGTWGSYSEGQTCQSNGAWSGSYSLTSPPGADTIIRYAAATSGCGTWGDYSETRTCQSNGAWSGSYSLTSPPSADSRTRYAAANSACGTYGSSSETQYCQSNSAWSGSYSLTSPPSADTITRYAAATSACGTYGSLSQTRTCQSNGTWSGSYSLTSPPGADTRTMYAAATSACGTWGSYSEGQTCQSNGAWTGSYSLGSAPSASTRTGFTSSSVNCSSSCTTQGQTCQSNGAWSGTGIGSCSAVTCSGGTPICSAGSCVQCVYDNDCGMQALFPSYCSGGNVMSYTPSYSCISNTCVAGSSVLQTCATAGTCQTGGGCSYNPSLDAGSCVDVTNVAAGSAGTGCNTLHYRCDGYGNCTSPTYTSSYSYPGGSPCSSFCSSLGPMNVGCYSARVQCWESPSYVYYDISCGSSYSCNSAYMMCTCTLYSYN